MHSVGAAVQDTQVTKIRSGNTWMMTEMQASQSKNQKSTCSFG